MHKRYLAVTRITLANRDQAVYEVKGRKPLLDELRDQGVDLPYGCRYGGCITCAAKLISGEVDQRAQVALNNRQIKDGYIVCVGARAKLTVFLKLVWKAMTSCIATRFLTRWHRMS
ncbi:MAG: hypothetical protein CM15mP95_0180 [Alphaproteobacteria bacterium]|nr:MAG: hypothetical protein CM15mP95_0180 [Alphaproteobacteria bacterium]